MKVFSKPKYALMLFWILWGCSDGLQILGFFESLKKSTKNVKYSTTTQFCTTGTKPLMAHCNK